MEWETRFPSTAARMKAPEDGLVASTRPQGWLAATWLDILPEVESPEGARVSQGRAFARGGRVRDLWFAPGLANAEVIDTAPHPVSLRVKTFTEDEWSRLLDLLEADLSLVALLLEGELSRALADATAAAGLSLIPTAEELSGDCTCADYVHPCAHVAAVHTLLADALEGDPFLLLTLRGRDRDRLLSDLRGRWGDSSPLHGEGTEHEVTPRAEIPWYEASDASARVHFDFHVSESAPSGLGILGLAPGGVDLLHALGPLYEAGARAALDLAHSDQRTSPDAPRWREWRERLVVVDAVRPVDGAGVGEEADVLAPASNEEPATDFTEAVVDFLAALDGAKSKQLSTHLGVSLQDLRAELIELEKLGIVYRTGKTRGTQWWLG